MAAWRHEVSTMRTSSTFTILSTNAQLLEVSGDGPIADVPGGLTIPDGAATTAPVDLLNAPIRRWRVDAPRNAKTSINVSDSPFGAFVQIRRCEPAAPPATWWSCLTVERWPRLSAFLKRRAPSILQLWYLFEADVRPCTWQDVGDGNTSQAEGRGGDLVVVTFVSP
jgi:hypothetical protein